MPTKTATAFLLVHRTEPKQTPTRTMWDTVFVRHKTSPPQKKVGETDELQGYVSIQNGAVDDTLRFLKVKTH